MTAQHALAPADRIPAEVHCAQDYEALARRFIGGPAYAYVAGGSGADATVEANRRAFAELEILPRLLRDVTAGSTRLRLLGSEFAHPIVLAPVAFHKLVHPRGEVETARGAAASDACIACSTLSSCSLEEIAGHAGPNRWFQLYFQPRREASLDLVRRAEAAGYTALVVTLDASIQAHSVSALRAGFRMPNEMPAANLANYPAIAPRALPPGASRVFQGLMAAAPTVQDLAWLSRQTRLPVLAKGVLHPEDALALRALGVAGIVVSNHGGRTLDGVPASLKVLPAVRRAVGNDFPLLLDGGIRSGTDVFKALASGADAVMIGRLQLHALSVAGALGVAHLLRLLREELEVCMALAGCPTLSALGADALHRP